MRREKTPARQTGYARGACILLPPPANKYADISATVFRSAVKMIKKEYRLSHHLEMLKYIWKLIAIADLACLLLGINAHPRSVEPLFLLATVAIAFEDPTPLALVPQTHFLFVSSGSGKDKTSYCRSFL